ncbi:MULTISPECIES: hypothetical protein [unclassified Parabacteroides]|uniref:hypothetical protein n=1 Tax=unclassified Parabacteroides TaxID=2649774 RepID=UPI00247614D4|nr:MULTISPECIES: hypothetical protein [unclassified Parabacteroides]
MGNAALPHGFEKSKLKYSISSSLPTAPLCAAASSRAVRVLVNKWRTLARTSSCTSASSRLKPICFTLDSAPGCATSSTAMW